MGDDDEAPKPKAEAAAAEAQQKLAKQMRGINMHRRREKGTESSSQEGQRGGGTDRKTTSLRLRPASDPPADCPTVSTHNNNWQRSCLLQAAERSPTKEQLKREAEGVKRVCVARLQERNSPCQ